MKHARVSVLAAVVVMLSMILATDASARTVGMGSANASYAGVPQASGDAYNWWYGNDLRVNISYADQRKNSYSVYAKAEFFQLTRTCTWYRHCSTGWKSLGQRRAPNINTLRNGNSVSFSQGTSGVGTYAASYQICVDVPLRAHPCSVSHRVAFQR